MKRGDIEKMEKTNKGKKTLLSLLTIGAVVALAFTATASFFSDSETSVGNTLAGGDINLQIDNESFVIDYLVPGLENPTGLIAISSATTWNLRDLTTVERFFDFQDLKPGDFGEDTISIDVGSNDAWMCAAAQITRDANVTCTDPENGDDPNCAVSGEGQGELDEQINFAFWVDDGDNVFENNEKIFLEGPISGLGKFGQIALADSQGSILGVNPQASPVPVPGGREFFIGKYWFFGNMEAIGATPGDGSPAVRQVTGFTCSGDGVNNAAQTDIVVADIQFYAEQARNNDTFTCGNWHPVWPTQPT